MTSIMTFCTANIPATVFNKLLEESAKAENAVQFLCLIRTPDQEEIEHWGVEGPIEDFQTGFLGKTEDELRHYYRQFLAERGNMRTISNRWMAQLDETSVANSTIVLYYGQKKARWDSGYEGEESGRPIPGNGRVCDDGYIWWSWRVPFRYAYSFFIGIEHCDDEVMELYSRPEYLRPDGVVDVETCDKIIEGELPDPMGILDGRAAEE